MAFSPFDGLSHLFVGTLGEPMVYRAKSGAQYDTSGIYALKTMIVDGDGGVAVEVVRPVVSVSEKIIANPRVNDTVFIRNAQYTVRSVQNDGMGMVMLVLSAPAPLPQFAAILSESGGGILTEAGDSLSN